MSPRLSELLLSSQSDERLVSLARAGHERAFAAIVERYAPELQAMARRLCSDGRSEDLVQQAFLSAFMALRSGCEVRHLRGWLYRILRNTAGRSDTPTFVPLDGGIPSVQGLEEIVQQRATAMTALSEIARLPARQRQAMIGTALDGRARAEVANSMGLSEGAVRQLVHRARTTLRSAVTAVTPWPLARWIVAAGPDAPGPGELAAGAGAASSGGLALKLGALLASGTLLTGAAVHLQARPAHRGDARAATSVHARPAAARAHPVVVASVAPPVLAPAGSPGPRPATSARSVSRPAANVGALQLIVRHGRHGDAPAWPGSRSGGSHVGGRDDGPGERSDSAGSSGSGRHDGAGAGAPSPTRSGSGTSSGGRDGGGGDGSRTNGDGGSSGSSAGGGTGSDDGAATIASDSPSLDTVLDGSDSGSGSGSGETSSVGSISTSGSGSDGGSTSDGGSLSSDGGGTSGSGSGSGKDGGTSGH